MLPEAGLKSLYVSGEDEPYDFFLDGLINSTSLDLGLGYFSSSAIQSLSVGFALFIKHGGTMRILINNILSEQDKEAIAQGYENALTVTLEENIINDVIRLKQVLSKRDEHFFKCLSWLISTNRIDIKASIPKKNKAGIVHQKFGIFKDAAANTVAFTGSVNFSANALFHNVEDLWCDFSWLGNTHINQRISHFECLFKNAWAGKSDTVEIIPLDQVKVRLRDIFPVSGLDALVESELDLISSDLLTEIPEKYRQKLNLLQQALGPKTSRSRISKTTSPDLRGYQKEAIGNWRANDFKGIMAMATGTGKTFTALGALCELEQQQGRLFAIILCPFIHLAEQWIDEAKKFNIDATLVGESKQIWADSVARDVQLFKRGRQDRVVLISTNASFTSPEFQRVVQPCLAEATIVIDEVHYAGAYSIRNLLPAHARYRLGLSATPERHNDKEGTLALFDYFEKVIYELSIKQAIGTFLTPYYYHAVPVELTEEEFEEYCELTEAINRLISKTDIVSQAKVEKLSIQRARVQNNSINKIKWLRSNIKTLPFDYSLFYAGDQIFDEVKKLLGRELKIRIHEFTSRQSRKERKKLLEEFAEQKIQALIAMKCLDEGVDVPPTRVAYFMASSSNPREFVQRRGRVLRKFEGKEHAVLYDLISIPPAQFIKDGRRGKKFSAVKSAFVKEYKRVQEFSTMAINHFDALNELFAMAGHLDLLDVTNEHYEK